MWRILVIPIITVGWTNFSQAESIEFVSAYDTGAATASGGGWLGLTSNGGDIIATLGVANAIIDLRFDAARSKLHQKYAIQNLWNAKKNPVADAETSDTLVAPPGNCVLSADNRHFYTNGFGGCGFPVHYSRDLTTGRLTLIPFEQDQIDAGSGLPNAIMLVISPDGKALYATSHHSVYAFALEDPSGKVELLQIIEDDSKGASMPGEEVVRFHKIPGADSVNKLRSPSGLQISSDGRFVYVTSYSERAITVFSRDQATHRLKFVESVYDELVMGKFRGTNHGLTFAKKLALSPDGTSLYVATLQGSVVLFQRDKESGKLVYVETVRKNEATRPALDYCVDLCVSRDGKQVYVACPTTNSIVVFARDGADQGKLDYRFPLNAKTAPGCRLAGVSRLCTTRDGKYLLAMSSEALVNVFRRTDLK